MTLPRLVRHDVYGARVAAVEMDLDKGKYDPQGVATTDVLELWADGHVTTWTRWTCSNGKVFQSKRKKKFFLLELKQDTNGVEGMVEAWRKIYIGKGWRPWSAEELRDK